ncbi:DUF4333 domain-containing protein [Conexibacter sp. JD483]|uniref:DUF4333 domain-containing protein n=1 Tax=unclassified Conexibacter TaxID=2627773 RepID=UPI0027263BAB|nr:MULTISPECIES: DUF4333 domain-containing protein [unclassified Conexibacter]MDO8188375.1 DUF4333 domain-containing protein [Conexibacter sp. CPCC 205706]MDO8201121.1 DUF4333 domain-containing protein [Conexibacter sp. CPCC 205762]MDR9371579.1 DUF4333 domain-containing protein [Conexibacter sp. JD483]
MKISHTRAVGPAALLACAALAVTGCEASFSTGSTKIDPDKAARLARQLVNAGEVKSRTIDCPSDVDAESGKTFVCEITWADGTTGRVTFHMTSDDGDISAEGRDVEIDK